MYNKKRMPKEMREKAWKDVLKRKRSDKGVWFRRLLRAKVSDEEMSKILKMPKLLQKELLKKINYFTPREKFLMEMCYEFGVDRGVRVDVVRGFWYQGFFLVCDKLGKKIAITFGVKTKWDKRARRSGIVEQIESLGVKHYDYYGSSEGIKEILEKEFGVR
jgi:hypothetical protein